MRELFGRLTEMPGISGHERSVRFAFRDALAGYVDSVEADRMGNLLAYQAGQAVDGPRVMLHAHLDEVGLVVSAIEESGILRFIKIGAVDDRVLASQLVLIHTRQGAVPGLIGLPSLRRLSAEEKGRPYAAGKLFIDLGAFSRQEAEARGVRVGDPVTFSPGILEWPNGVLVSKSCDDRIGLAILAEVMEQLAAQPHQATVIAAALTQHEVGLKGAATAARKAHPDIAIHIDITGSFPDDPPGGVAMGGGPVFRILEGFGADVPFGAQRGVFCSQPVLDLLIETAQREGIAHQLQIKPGIINDGVEIQPIDGGVHVGYVLVPARYNHSAHEVILWSDVEQTVRLLVAFCRQVDTAFLAEADQAI